jgi:hypothetical protein
VGEHEILKHWNHEPVSTALQEEVDPVLKSSPSRELRAEHFVLGENQKNTTDRNSKRG